MHGFGFMAGPSPWASHSVPCWSKLAPNHCLASACRLQALKRVAQWEKKKISAQLSYFFNPNPPLINT